MSASSSSSSSTTTTAATANRYKSNQPPPLPLTAFNTHLLNYKGKLRSVRTQDISLGNSTITIARIKIPAPEKISSHLIKRFDTNAISATSFFKSAFPHSSDEEESIQMEYLHKIYDTRQAGALDLGPDHKLTGVWVPIQHATELADAYGLLQFAAPLISFANPNPTNHDQPIPSSPIKNLSEQETTNENKHTPKLPSSVSSQAKQQHVAQTPQTRSSKRSRVGPPCFGNTSPSGFNLSSLNKPQTDYKNKKSNADQPSSIEAPPPAAISTIPTSNQVHSSPKADKSSSKEQGNRLIGTDDQVNKAKQEALKLVSTLRSSRSTDQAQGHDPSLEPGSKSSGQQGFTKSPNKEGARVTKKRNAQEVLGSDSEDAEPDESAEPTSLRQSFLPKLLWRKSADNGRKRAAKKTATNSRAQLASLESESMPGSPLNANKRNLAIAGIVLAGAAASIAPYFF